MNRTLALAVTAAAAAALFVAAPASAETPAPQPAPAPISPKTATVDADATAPALPRIAPRSAQSFAEPARKLDPGLAKAVTRDLGITPAQYLADAATAQDAAALVSALHDETGAQVSATLDGPAVTVYAADAHTAELARGAGATAVVGEAPRHDIGDQVLVPKADVYGGQPYFIGAQAGGSGFRCSAGFPGYALSNGAPQLLSAGHCWASGTSTYELNLTAPTSVGGTGGLGGALGGWVPGSVQFGNDADSSLIALTPGHTSRPGLLTWGGGTGAPLASAPQTVTSVGPAVVGAPLCKSGSTTGWSCGTVLATDQPVSVQGAQGTINAIIASTCSDHGDSGGAAVSGTTAVGVVSAGPDVACGTPDFFTAFYPMVASAGPSSVTSRYGTTWEPAVAVPATVSVTSLTGSNTVVQGGTISGTVSGASPGDYIKLKLATESTARTASIVNGAWSVSLANAPTGSTTYTVNAAWGKYSAGAAVSGPVQITPIATDRLSGADRFETSVAIAKKAYPTTADTVYIASGLNYPDALSAGPAAAAQHAPLLLSGYTLPESVRAEIASLQPKHILVVGGPAAVPDAVETALKQLSTDVQRVAGGDRFETSRLLATKVFGSTIPTAFLVSGTNFPDALAAGAAAGAKHSPVVLVNGGLGSVDAATTSFLHDSSTTSAFLVGGTAVMTPGIQSGLTQQGLAVTRYAGGDRFETSEVVGRSSFPSYTEAYIASGLGFPDALSGSAVAAAKGVPLFTVNGWCVPRSVASDLAAQGVQQAWLLGGTNSLGATIDTLTVC